MLLRLKRWLTNEEQARLVYTATSHIADDMYLAEYMYPQRYLVQLKAPPE
jgi:hypothetical protein